MNPPSLAHLFIFLPKKVPEGQEEKKILLFFPPAIDLGLQCRHLGLSEAFVNFTRQFSPNKAVETGIFYCTN